MNYELPTKDGKKITLENPKIVISKHANIDSGYFVDLKLVGKLPGCRKVETLTVSPYSGIISVTTLFNYRKHVAIEPEEFRKLIHFCPVTTPSYTSEPFELTHELVDFARKKTENICDCPAVTQVVEKLIL
jgi:hypothetical protein